MFFRWYFLKLNANISSIFSLANTGTPIVPHNTGTPIVPQPL